VQPPVLAHDEPDTEARCDGVQDAAPHPIEAAALALVERPVGQGGGDELDGAVLVVRDPARDQVEDDVGQRPRRYLRLDRLDAAEYVRVDELALLDRVVGEQDREAGGALAEASGPPGGVAVLRHRDVLSPPPASGRRVSGCVGDDDDVAW
jgi:hypothetical protein